MLMRPPREKMVIVKDLQQQVIVSTGANNLRMASGTSYSVGAAGRGVSVNVILTLGVRSLVVIPMFLPHTICARVHREERGT